MVKGILHDLRSSKAKARRFGWLSERERWERRVCAGASGATRSEATAGACNKRDKRRLGEVACGHEYMTLFEDVQRLRAVALDMFVARAVTMA